MIYNEIKIAYDLFYKSQFLDAEVIFARNNLTYEAGMCSLLVGDIKKAKKYFQVKSKICPASDFGLIILDIIEKKPLRDIGYFQVRSFLEVFLNLLIENSKLDWAQEIINKYDYFSKFNLETPKFIARILYASGYTKVVHSFADYAKEICRLDAEIYYIDASLYIDEENYDKAKSNIDFCTAFAPEYFPILQLRKKLLEKTGGKI